MIDSVLNAGLIRLSSGLCIFLPSILLGREQAVVRVEKTLMVRRDLLHISNTFSEGEGPGT